MALFLNLYLGHLIADYALQPGVLVRAKREGLGALLLHVAVVGAATSLVMWDLVVYFWPIIVLATGAHFVIEKLTIAARVQTPTRGLFVFVFDQTLHVLSLVLLVWLTAGWEFSATGRVLWMEMDIESLAILDAFLTVTLLGSILVFEAAGAFVGDPSHDTRILKWGLPRMLGMAERAGALGVGLLTSDARVALGTMALVFMPRIAWAFTRSDRTERARQYIEGATGLVLCTLCLVAVMAVRTLARM